MLARLLRSFGRLVADRSGNFALITAVAIIPILGGVGVAVDYVYAVNIKTRLDNAADAASLGAIAESSRAMQIIPTMRQDGRIPQGEEDAVYLFNASFNTDREARLESVQARVEKTGWQIRSTVTYRAQVPTFFMGMMNKDTVTVAGEAVSVIEMTRAMDFYLLLDNTPSMGVGATTSDINRLVNNTPDRCAFACHALNSSDNYYNLAKSLGVAMRIDVVRQATQDLLDKAADIRQYQEQFRMAVYTFGAAATNMRLTEVGALTSRLDRLQDRVDRVDLMTIPHQNYDNDQQTDFDTTLESLNRVIPDPGTGVQGDEPQKILFFVSDGVGDSYKPADCTKRTTGSGRCQEPIDTRYCEIIKARGIKIAVLYTTYLPLPTNGWYNSWIRPFEDEIGTRMEDCASPGLFFEVSPSEGISDAMNALFMKAVSIPRLAS